MKQNAGDRNEKSFHLPKMCMMEFIINENGGQCFPFFKQNLSDLQILSA